MVTASKPRQLKVIAQLRTEQIPQLERLSKDQLLDMQAVAAVLPFRVNNYVTEDLIDWDKLPDDPIYQLVFPQPRMLESADFQRMRRLIADGAPKDAVTAAARDIQRRMNPHPAGQKQLNVPHQDGHTVPGMQHKYRETVLFFPLAGQTCHAYCTYCFRWAQFVGLDDLKFASGEPQVLVNYLKAHPEVTSVLFTGGDPMVMNAPVLRRYIEPLLDPSLNLLSIRIGTKSPAYWPYRFVSDPDADDVLRLFEQVRNSGRNMAIMAHYSHPRELQTEIAQQCIVRLRNSGAMVRCQAPIIKYVNDDPNVWAEMWKLQIRHNAVPYYAFVERDTGPKEYFRLPLTRCLDIYNGAIRQVSGLGRTVRGPSMSCTPGKVLVDGVVEIGGEKVFALKFLQGRNPEWTGRIFFAQHDSDAAWLDELKPAFGEREFFFEPELREMAARGNAQVWVNEDAQVAAQFIEEN